MKEAPDIKIEEDVPIRERSVWLDVLRKMTPNKSSVVLTIAQASALRAQARMHRMKIEQRAEGPNKVRCHRTK